MAIGGGTAYSLFSEGFYPVNVLNAVKQVPEVLQGVLRHRQPHGSDCGGYRTGARHYGCCGRPPPAGIEGEEKLRHGRAAQALRV